MSEHKVEVVEVKLEKHPNADSLSVVRVGDFTVCARTQDWHDGQLAAYIEPDYMVPSERPEFNFLGASGSKEIENNGVRGYRIKCKRLRGVMSMGLLVPAPEGAVVGDDVMGYFGIARYEPKIQSKYISGGDCVSPPPGYHSKYDIESAYKYAGEFVDGEEVVVTEKVHGCLKANMRVAMADGSHRRISSICVGDEVLGVNDFGAVVPSSVIRKYNNGVANEWMKIKTTRQCAGRGCSYSSITCTPEHKFWNPDRKLYVSANDLSVGDSVSIIRSERSLTPIQEQVLLGKILGDGHIAVSKSTAAVSWAHSKEDLEYAQWTATAVGDLDSGTRDEYVSGYGTNMVRFRTIGSWHIKDKFECMAASSGSPTPEWVADEMTPISIAFWYMDDGSLGEGSDGSEDKANFAVCAYTEDDCNVLMKGLAKFGITAVYFKHDGYSRLRLNSDDAEKLFLLIAPYIPPCMQRKLPSRYRGWTGWMPNASMQYKPTLVNQSITSIERFESRSGESNAKHDLETDTGNYFASGMLVHNSNARFTYSIGDGMYCGSRTEWKKESINNLWWSALYNTVGLQEWCESHPDLVVYGEVYGQVQDLKYGATKGEVWFAAFDIRRLNGDWLDHDEARAIYPLEWVPLLHRGPWNKEAMFALADGDSVVAANRGVKQIREGIVIKPIKERRCDSIGRVQVKIVSNSYLERA